MLCPSLTSPPSKPHFFFSGRRRNFLLPPAASVLNFPGKLSDHIFYPQRSIDSFHLTSRHRAIAEAAVTASRADDEVEQVSGGSSEFISVGYLSCTHGIKGELRVKPNTDFPELRFCKPGLRWLRSRVLGKEIISELMLIKGRSHTSQKCWIVRFKGIDTVEKAKKLVGSTFLVREQDRPKLDEDAFYTGDLFGMRVILKETGVLVGTVTNVFNTGASDILHVKRYSSHLNKRKLDHSDTHLPEKDSSDQILWIPFVKAIVPDVDMDKREMLITPPRGLLELNLHSDRKSKKERRQMEWNQRKKFQKHFSASKKKLHTIGQGHILGGFNTGNKDQRAMLARQIVDINLSLFQHAVQSIQASSMRLNLIEFMGANSEFLSNNTLKISSKDLMEGVYPEKYDEFFNGGLRLLNNSKAAIILVINDDSCLKMISNEFVLNKLQQLLLDYKRFFKCGEKCNEIPLIILTSDGLTKPSELLFSANGYFGFNSEKVLFIEETKLPIISDPSDSPKILLNSPWEILMAPTGSGGAFVSFSTKKVVDFLQKMDVEYVQICSLGERSAFGNPLFFGWALSCRAHTALKVSEDTIQEDSYDLIFSFGQLCKICKDLEALPFQAAPATAPANSYSLHCSIYSALNLCTIDEVCILQVLE